MLSHLLKTDGVWLKRALSFSCHLSVPKPLIHSAKLNWGLERQCSQGVSGGSLQQAGGAVGSAQHHKTPGDRISLCFLGHLLLSRWAIKLVISMEKHPIRIAVSLKPKSSGSRCQPPVEETWKLHTFAVQYSWKFLFCNVKISCFNFILFVFIQTSLKLFNTVFILIVFILHSTNTVSMSCLFQIHHFNKWKKCSSYWAICFSICNMFLFNSVSWVLLTICSY